MNSKISINKHGIFIDGKYTTLLCASLYYFRIPHELWKDRIKKLKKTGYNCVDVYFPWNFHEKTPGEWCFLGEADVNEFLDILAEENMYVIARPGPYICSEWDGGSIPSWVLTKCSPIRDNNPTYLEAAKKWYEKIMPKIAAHDINHGGSVILMQIENELDFFDCKNITEYMTELCKTAKSLGITIPLVGCAGQSSVKRAIGDCKELIPAYNLYPDVNDKSFDNKAHTISETLNKHNLPLIVTETSGDHFLLRREFANGAKFLGAYNQVAGNNFGFTNSINNWGDSKNPLSFISTEYGWTSVINSYGEYTKESFEGKLFSRFLNTFNEFFDSAKSKIPSDIKVTSNNILQKTVRVIETDSGSFLCVPNFCNKEAKFRIEKGSEVLEVTIPSHTSPFFAFFFKLNKVAKGFEIKNSTAEIIKAEKDTIYAYGEKNSELCVKFYDGYETKVAGNGIFSISGHTERPIKIVILTRREALALEFEAEIKKLSTSRKSYSATKAEVAPLSGNFKPLKHSKNLSMELNGVYRGYVNYDVRAERGKALLVSKAADIISAYCGEKYIDTRIGCGSFIKYEAQENNDFHFRVESWGHCNFDDARLPSLRMTSTKGFEHIYTINKEENNFVWRFILCDKWLPKKLELKKSEFDAILDPNSWNSTRVPLIAAYYTKFTTDSESDSYVVELKGGSTETALYVGDKLAGVFNLKAPFIDITKFVKEGICDLTLLCRKIDWSLPVGNLKIYNLKKLSAKISTLTDKDILNINCHGEVEKKLPLLIKPGETKYCGINLDSVPHSCEHARVVAQDCKLTAVFNGHIVGRIIGDTDLDVTLSGGDSKSFYIPRVFYKESGNNLSLYIEGIGKNPCLTSLDFEETFA